MYDNYNKTIKKDGIFFAGYNHNGRCGKHMLSFLFTTLRILRIKSGDADWKIGDKVWKIKKGDIVVVNNTELRRFITSSSDFEFNLIAFTPTVFTVKSRCLSIFYNRADNFVPVFSSNDKNYTNILLLLKMLEELFMSDNEIPEAVALISNLLTAAVSYMTIDRRSTLNFTSSSIATAELIANTVYYIQHHLADDLSIKTLADKASLCRGYFTSAFKHYTGTTPAKFIVGLRVANVVHLLNANPNLNVLDAAFSSGFDSSSGFYKAFESICGISPLQYVHSGSEYIRTL